MRNTFLIAIFLLLVVLTSLVLYSRLSKRGSRVEQPAENGDVAQNPASITSTIRTDSNVVSNTPTNRMPSRPLDTNAQPTAKGEAFHAAVAEKNVPIYFWGKVVDQDDAPLAGVKIQMSIRQWVSDSTGMTAEFPLFNKET